MTFKIQHAYECKMCGWFRDVGLNPEITRFDHMIYGRRTQTELAALDIMNHTCVNHLRSTERAKALREWAAHVTLVERTKESKW